MPATLAWKSGQDSCRRPVKLIVAEYLTLDPRPPTLLMQAQEHIAQGLGYSSVLAKRAGSQSTYKLEASGWNGFPGALFIKSLYNLPWSLLGNKAYKGGRAIAKSTEYHTAVGGLRFAGPPAWRCESGRNDDQHPVGIKDDQSFTMVHRLGLHWVTVNFW